MQTDKQGFITDSSNAVALRADAKRNARCARNDLASARRYFELAKRDLADGYTSHAVTYFGMAIDCLEFAAMSRRWASRDRSAARGGSASF